MLAWIRTALGFIAGGVALIYVSPADTHPAMKYTLGAAMVAVGIGVALTGGLRWHKTNRALRSGSPMPAPAAVFVLIAAVVVIAFALVITAAVVGV